MNLTTLARVEGGIIGGSVNYASTRAVGTWAKHNFPDNRVSDNSLGLDPDES